MPDHPANNPPIRAVVMSLFPSFNSLEDAQSFAQSKLPINHINELHGVLMAYQNTLINLLSKKENHAS